MRLGADVDELERLRDLLSAGARLLGTTTASLRTAVGGASWVGPDAERFRGAWRGTSSAALRSVAASLDDAALALGAQIGEQRRVSAPGGGASSGGRERPAGPPPVGLRVIEARSELSVATGTASAARTYRVEELADGTSWVSEFTGVELGREVAVDRRVSVVWDESEWGSGVGAAAAIGLGGGASMVWRVPTADVDGLVVARGMGADPGERSALGSAIGAIPGAGVWAGVFGATDEFDALTAVVAEPEWVGLSASAWGDAGGTALAGDHSLAAGATVDESIAVAVRRSDGAVAVEFSSDLALELDAGASGGASPAEGAAATTVRLVLAADGSPERLDGAVVTGAIGSAAHIVERHVTVDLTDPSVRPALDRLGVAATEVVGHAARGDLPGAAAAAGSVVPELREALAVLVVHATSWVEEYRLDPGGSDAVGVSTPVGGVELSSRRLAREPG